MSPTLPYLFSIKKNRCIEKWLRTQQKCPQCNRPSKKTEIRRLYAKCIKVIDTAELDKALRDIENERVLRKRAEQETSEIRLRFQILRDELTVEKERYRSLLERTSMQQQQLNFDLSMAGKNPLTALGSSTSGEKTASASFSYTPEKMINLTEVIILKNFVCLKVG
jgi:hypothetical protein